MELHINATSFLKNKLWLINVLFDRQIFRLILVFCYTFESRKTNTPKQSLSCEQQKHVFVFFV